MRWCFFGCGFCGGGFCGGSLGGGSFCVCDGGGGGGGGRICNCGCGGVRWGWVDVFVGGCVCHMMVVCCR